MVKIACLDPLTIVFEDGTGPWEEVEVSLPDLNLTVAKLGLYEYVTGEKAEIVGDMPNPLSLTVNPKGGKDSVSAGDVVEMVVEHLELLSELQGELKDKLEERLQW